MIGRGIETALVTISAASAGTVMAQGFGSAPDAVGIPSSVLWGFIGSLLGLCGFLAWQLISGIKNNLCDLQSKMDKMADHMQALQTKEGCLEVRGRLRETSCDEWRMGTDLDDIRGG